MQESPNLTSVVRIRFTRNLLTSDAPKDQSLVDRVDLPRIVRGVRRRNIADDGCVEGIQSP
jgi:hypothetical protein